MTITNDGATILGLLEVEHPAAKILVDLAQLQDQEVGDGTTSVVNFFFTFHNFCHNSRQLCLEFKLNIFKSINRE